MADVEAVGDGAHDGAHSEAVEVVVHEDDDAQYRRQDLRHLGILDMGGYPFGVCA